MRVGPPSNMRMFARAIGFAWSTACLMLAMATTAYAKTIEIAYVGQANTAFENGVKQGLLEANLQGEFLGVTYELTPLATASNPAAIIVGSSDDEIIAHAKRNPRVPVFNIASPNDSLRALCMPNLFHTLPSHQMFSDALAQWRQKNTRSDAQPRAWHRTFRKYAAAQLNSRYHETFEKDMNDEAWAGWAATKLLADVLIRAPELMNEGLINELKTNVAFDGQKGIDMSFRETGQLAQPLLLIENDRIAGEAPVRGVVDITDLDSLGETSCPK